MSQSKHKVYSPEESTSYADIDFYHHCHDTVLALAMSLNKTIGGTYIHACIIYCILNNALLL